jgi:hypothetical protein
MTDLLGFVNPYIACHSTDSVLASGYEMYDRLLASYVRILENLNTTYVTLPRLGFGLGFSAEGNTLT